MTNHEKYQGDKFPFFILEMEKELSCSSFAGGAG